MREIRSIWNVDKHLLDGTLKQPQSNDYKAFLLRRVVFFLTSVSDWNQYSSCLTVLSGCICSIAHPVCITQSCVSKVTGLPLYGNASTGGDVRVSQTVPIAARSLISSDATVDLWSFQSHLLSKDATFAKLGTHRRESL